MNTLCRTLLSVGVLLFHGAVALGDDIPLIDAHSQLPAPGTAGKVIELMDKAGVAHAVAHGNVERLWRLSPVTRN